MAADLLQSYERDFDQCMGMLNKIVTNREPYDQQNTTVALGEASKLLK